MQWNLISFNAINLENFLKIKTVREIRYGVTLINTKTAIRQLIYKKKITAMTCVNIYAYLL